MKRPKPEQLFPNNTYPDELTTPPTVNRRYIEFAQETADQDRYMFLEYCKRGFTEDQALQLTIARGGTVRLMTV